MAKSSFYGLLWKNKTPPGGQEVPEINTEQLKGVAEGIKAAGGIIEEVKKMAESTQPKPGQKPSETFEEANKILEGAKSFSEKIKPQTPSVADSIKGVKEIIQESKTLTEEIESGDKTKNKRRFNVTDEGQIFADPDGEFSFSEAIQISRERKPDNSKPQTYYIYDAAKGEMKEVTGPTVFNQPTPPQTYFVDENGEVRKVESGAPIVIRGQNNRPPSPPKTWIVQPDGSVEEYEPGKPIVIIKQLQPSNTAPYQLIDRDGKPVNLTKEQLDTQIEYWKATDGMKRDDEKHKGIMELLGEVKKNIAPGIGAGIAKLTGSSLGATGALPTGSKTGEKTKAPMVKAACWKCRKPFRYDPGEEAICPYCKTNQNVQCPSCEAIFTPTNAAAIVCPKCGASLTLPGEKAQEEAKDEETSPSSGEEDRIS
jgi:archaellum component FlaC